MPDAPPFADFRDHILKSTRDIAAKFEDASDDWQPMIVADTPTGVTLIPLRGPMSETPQLAYGALTEIGARLAAHVHGGYALTGKQEVTDVLEGRIRRPRDNPDAREILIVRVASPQEVEVWMADVTRGQGSRRVLGKYEEGKALGAESNALQAALRAAR